jgi:hypothetical protein
MSCGGRSSSNTWFLKVNLNQNGSTQLTIEINVARTNKRPAMARKLAPNTFLKACFVKLLDLG